MPIPENKELKALIKVNTRGISPHKTETHIGTTIPNSAKAGPLGVYWKARLDELEPIKYHSQIKKEEWGMLGHLGKYLGDEAGKVIDYVLRHWTEFGWKALNNTGVKAYPPEEPNIGFLLKYHCTGVNMMLSEMESIAKKKEYEEKLATQQAHSKEAQNAMHKVKSTKPSVTLLQLSPEQLCAYFDMLEDPINEAWVNRVSEKYGEWRPARADEKGIPCDIEFKKAG